MSPSNSGAEGPCWHFISVCCNQCTGVWCNTVCCHQLCMRGIRVACPPAEVHILKGTYSTGCSNGLGQRKTGWLRSRLVGCRPLGSHLGRKRWANWLSGRPPRCGPHGSQSINRPGLGGTTDSAVFNYVTLYLPKWRTRRARRAIDWRWCELGRNAEKAAGWIPSSLVKFRHRI
jgi:hypothetical protein